MKIIFGSCGFRNEYESDLLKNKISCRLLKRIQAGVGLELVSHESHIGLNIFFWLYCHCCLISVYFCKGCFHIHLGYLLLLIMQEKNKIYFPIKDTADFSPRGSTLEEATDNVINHQIPKLQELMKNKEIVVDNIDVFCEKGVFGIDETKRILKAGKAAGLAVNFHGDELHPMKAAEVHRLNDGMQF